MVSLIFVLSNQGCAPALQGVVVDQSGLQITSSEGRINISRLDAPKQQMSTMVLEIQANGRFQSQGSLEAGSYLVEALVPGYKLMTTQVKLEKSQELTLTLQKLPAGQQNTIRYSETQHGIGAGKVTITPPQM
jgi:hypothetical protein